MNWLVDILEDAEREVASWPNGLARRNEGAQGRGGMKTPEEIISELLALRLRCGPVMANGASKSFIADLAAAGYVIVPKEPNLQMLNAASEALVPSGDALACWHAMLDAKP